LDFAHLVLEALERGKLAFVDHDVVAHQAHARTTANDALGDAATGDLADLGDVEHFQDLGVAQEFFADFRREHTREHRFDVVHHVVDDVVVADFDAVSARTFARTLKPMIAAPDACARITSYSVMPPTPDCSVCTATSSVPSFSSAPWMASTEPCTSALMTRGNRRFSPSLRVCSNWSSVWREVAFWRCSRRLRARYSVTSRARASDSTTTNSSPASGAAERPSTSTGTDGPALSTVSPRSLTSARTRPHSDPATRMSPCFSVPRCTSTVATGPRPLSSLASITAPSAVRFGFAFRSRISAC